MFHVSLLSQSTPAAPPSWFQVLLSFIALAAPWMLACRTRDYIQKSICGDLSSPLNARRLDQLRIQPTLRRVRIFGTLIAGVAGLCLGVWLTILTGVPGISFIIASPVMEFCWATIDLIVFRKHIAQDMGANVPGSLGS
jgi:hypothetical protein